MYFPTLAGVGGWASSSDDQWLVFEVIVMSLDDSPGTWGRSVHVFSHFDGHTWTAQAHLAQGERALVQDPPGGPGRRVWGRDASHITVSDWGANWSFDGKAWTRNQLPASSTWQTFGGDLAEPLVIEDGVGLHDDGTRTPLFRGVFDSFYGLSLTKTDVFALSTDVKLYRWEKDTWSKVADVPASFPSWALYDGETAGLKAFAADDIWVFGNKEYTSEILHYDGKAWGSRHVPEVDYAESDSITWSVWGPSPNDVWFPCERGRLEHWNGAGWSAIQYQDHDVRMRSAWGASSRDFWVTGCIVNQRFDQCGDWIVFHSDGAMLTEAKRITPRSPYISPGLWGSGPNDVYAWAGVGEPVLHWNGQAWSTWDQQSDYGIAAMWGSGPDDVWLIRSSAGAPTASPFLTSIGLRTVDHFDGKTITPAVMGVTTPLFTVSGSTKDDVWIVGANGATLRYAPLEDGVTPAR
jgi:hypothetical protein